LNTRHLLTLPSDDLGHVLRTRHCHSFCHIGALSRRRRTCTSGDDRLIAGASVGRLNVGRCDMHRPWRGNWQRRSRSLLTDNADPTDVVSAALLLLLLPSHDDE
jgi:hypothetical protein